MGARLRTLGVIEECRHIVNSILSARLRQFVFASTCYQHVLSARVRSDVIISMFLCSHFAHKTIDHVFFSFREHVFHIRRKEKVSCFMDLFINYINMILNIYRLGFLNILELFFVSKVYLLHIKNTPGVVKNTSAMFLFFQLITHSLNNNTAAQPKNELPEICSVSRFSIESGKIWRSQHPHQPFKRTILASFYLLHADQKLN